MKLPNPAKILRDAKAKKVGRQEAAEVLRERLQAAFAKNNKLSQNEFVAALKAQHIEATDMRRLAEESSQDMGVLIKWERKVGQENKATTLAEVKNRSTFSKVLIIIREIHASDIAEGVSFDDAAKLVITEVLLHP